MKAKKRAKSKNPCWKGYSAVGMKKKGGKTVPNCVPSVKSRKTKAALKKKRKSS